jgi:hypothetical protein
MINHLVLLAWIVFVEGASRPSLHLRPHKAGNVTTSEGQVQICGKVSLKGKRSYMEDYYYLSSSRQLAAVFDGHG